MNSRPNIGLIDMHISAFNQDKILVLEDFPKTFLKSELIKMNKFADKIHVLFRKEDIDTSRWRVRLW